MSVDCSETVNIEGKRKAVREIELLREHRCRVLTSADGAIYLEYLVGVGLYSIEIQIIHELSKEESKAWQAGNLDIGKLANTLSEVDQITGKHERQDGPAFVGSAERRGLRALMQLVRLEIDVLNRIGNAEEPSQKLKPMVAQLMDEYGSSDPAVLASSARRWAATLCDIHRLVDSRVPDSPYFAENGAIEKAIYETAMKLYSNGK